MEKNWENVRRAEAALAEYDRRREEQVGPRMAELPDLLRELNVRGDGDSPEAKALREERLALEREDEELREESARLASWASDARETLLRDEARGRCVEAREAVDRDLEGARRATGEAVELEAQALRCREAADDLETKAHDAHDAAEVLARIVGVEDARTGILGGRRGPLRRQIERGHLRRAAPAAVRILRERGLVSDWPGY